MGGPEQGPSEKDRNFKAPETGKGRFGNLEMVPPGLSDKELEDWKAKEKQKDQEAKDRAKAKRDEEIFEEDYGPKGQF